MNPLNPLHTLAPTLHSSHNISRAYRVWATLVNRCGVGGLQVAGIAAVRDRLTNDQLIDALAEVVARAEMELCIGIHFDHADSGVVRAVYELIGEVFSDVYAGSACERVIALGGECTLTPVAESALTGPRSE